MITNCLAVPMLPLV